MLPLALHIEINVNADANTHPLSGLGFSINLFIRGVVNDAGTAQIHLFASNVRVERLTS